MDSPCSDYMGENSSASSITLESESQVCHPDQDRTDQSFTSFQSPRSSSASTTTSDPDAEQTSSLYTEDSGSRKYRDGLESEHFVNKVARFEILSNTQQHPHQTNSHSNYGQLNQSHSGVGNGGYSGNLNNCNNGTTVPFMEGCSNGLYGKSLSKPNVNFNRSDQGYGSLYSSNYAYFNSNNSNISNSTVQDDSSISSSSVSPPDRISISTRTKSYRRPGVTFYEDGQLTSPSPALASLGFVTDDADEESSSFVNHSSATSYVPSPNSLSSISSNHRLYKSHNLNQNYHHNGHGSNGGERVQSRSGSAMSSSTTSSIIPHHQFNHYNNNNNHTEHSSFNGNNEAEIACETLLQIKRKQVRILK